MGGDWKAEQLLYSSGVAPEVTTATEGTFVRRTVIKLERSGRNEGEAVEVNEEDDEVILAALEKEQVVMDENEDDDFDTGGIEEDDRVSEGIEVNMEEEEEVVTEETAIEVDTDSDSDYKEKRNRKRQRASARAGAGKKAKREPPSTPAPKKAKGICRGDSTPGDDIPGNEEHSIKESRLNAEGILRWHCACGTTFSSRKGIGRHVRERTRDPEDLFNCEECTKSFLRRDQFVGHMKKYHPDKQLDKKAVGVKEGKEEEHKDNGQWEDEDTGEVVWCCTCGKVFEKRERMRRHVRERNMGEEQMRKCPECDKRFRRGTHLKEHLLLHQKKGNGRVGGNIKKVEVDGGNKEVVVVAAEKVEHGRVEDTSSKMADGTQFWKCWCGKIYLSEATLGKHLQEQLGNEVGGKGEEIKFLIKCQVCGKEFKHRFQRNLHMKRVHDWKEPQAPEAAPATTGPEPEPQTNGVASPGGEPEPEEIPGTKFCAF